MGTMEVAHGRRERKARSYKIEEEGEWPFVSGKKGGVVPFPHSKTCKGTLNGLVALNCQDLHGNADYLLRFTEKEGRKSFANEPPDHFNAALLLTFRFKSPLQHTMCPRM